MGTVSKYDTRQSLNHAALPGIGSAANTDLDVILGDINSIFAAATSAPTPSVIMKRDANANTQVNNLIENGQEITTSGATTILVVGSPYTNIFTGTATQTIQLPAANTLTENQQFFIVNNSTQSITVTNNGIATLQTMITNSQAVFTVTNIGSTNGTWSVAYSTGSAGGTVTSVTFTGDGTIFSSTPSTPVTTTGTLTATLDTQASNTYLGGSRVAGTVATPTFKTFLAPTVQQPGTGTYVPTYVVQCSSANVTAGAVYTTNGVNRFIATVTFSASTVVYFATTSGIQQAIGASGTFTKVSGTGDSTITYSSWSNSPLYIRLQIVGGGGGGSVDALGSGGSPGGNTIFTVVNPVTNSTVETLTAGGGQASVTTVNDGGNGGTPSVSAFIALTGIVVTGNAGSPGGTNFNGNGGNGGASPSWGGGGKGGYYAGATQSGTNGASPGAGGGGASGGNDTRTGGGGGGSGAWIDVILYNPWPVNSLYGYPVSIGAGGAGGTGGDAGSVGGTGGAGYVQITEYYQ